MEKKTHPKSDLDDRDSHGREGVVSELAVHEAVKEEFLSDVELDFPLNVKDCAVSECEDQCPSDGTEEVLTKVCTEYVVIKEEVTEVVEGLPTDVDGADFGNVVSAPRGTSPGEEHHEADKAYCCNSVALLPIQRVKEKLEVFAPPPPLEDTSHEVGPKSFQCVDCTCDCRDEEGLLSHRRSEHRGKRPFQCCLCAKCFSWRAHLICHVRTHTGEKPFKCAVCGAAFNQKTHLVSHVRLHTGHRPFSCPQPGCTACFTRKYHLSLHLRTHTGEKPYRCQLCDARFTNLSNLKTHVNAHK